MWGALFRSAAFAFLLVRVSSPGPAHAQVAVPKDRAAMAIASEGYLSNLENFPNLYCRFIVTDYPVNTVADAVAGRFGTPSMVNEGLILLHGDKERYRLGCPPGVLAEAMKKSVKAAGKRGENYGTLPCLEVNTLVSGRYKLTTGAIVRSADFYSSDDGPQPRRSPRLSPVTLGDMVPPRDPGTLLRDAAAGTIYGHYEGMQKIDGRNAMVFVVGESAKRITDKFYLDGERGFLPLRHEAFNPESGNRDRLSFFTGFRQYSGGRWYPERGLDMLRLWDEGRKPIIAREVRVTYLDADNPPPEGEFSIVIPKGCQVKDPSNTQALYVEEADRRVTAQNLPDLANVLHEAEERHKQWTLAGQYRQKFASRRRWIMVTVVLLLVGIGLFALWRKIRQESRSTPPSA